MFHPFPHCHSQPSPMVPILPYTGQPPVSSPFPGRCEDTTSTKDSIQMANILLSRLDWTSLWIPYNGKVVNPCKTTPTTPTTPTTAPISHTYLPFHTFSLPGTNPPVYRFVGFRLSSHWVPTVGGLEINGQRALSIYTLRPLHPVLFSLEVQLST